MDEEEEFTYVEVVCEAKLNATEDRKTIEKILRKFISGEAKLDERFDGDYLLIRQSGIESLQIFSDWVQQQRIIDTVRDRLIRSATGNITALYFNRQAAAMDRISLLDVNDNPPLGPIMLQIVTDSIVAVADEVTPRTWKGKVLSKEQWQKLRTRQKEMREQKERDEQRKQKYKSKYSD